MTNLIEYLILFTILGLFLPNNVISIIYLILNFIVSLVYFIICFIHYHKDSKNELFTKFNKKLIVCYICIFIVNLISKFSFATLIFGFICLGYFLYFLIKHLLKKDYEFKDQLLNESFLFDIFTSVYLVYLLVYLKVGF